MNDAVEFLVTQIRPDMLGLIESFDFADNVLNSAIGGRDGRVYETLCDWANLAPQN
jgi:acyl-CoA oxidase